MIRHSRSFFISLVIHSVLLMSVLFLWNHYSPARTVQVTQNICIKLSDVVIEEEIKKEESKVITKQIDKPILNPKKSDKPNKKDEKIVKQEIKRVEKIAEIEETIEDMPTADVVENKMYETKVQTTYTPTEDTLTEVVPQEFAVIDELTLKNKKRNNKKKLQTENAKQKHEKLAQEYLSINTQEIAKLLQDNLYYPRSARKRNITGEIVVKFTLGNDSKVYNIEVVESKSDILSRAAIKTIEDLSGKFPKSEKELTLYVPIGYELK